MCPARLVQRDRLLQRDRHCHRRQRRWASRREVGLAALAGGGLLAACALRQAAAEPQVGAAHVFAFSDSVHPHICHLANSVAAAGGRLTIFGVKHGKRSVVPGGTASGYEDLSWMVKKYWLLLDALRRLPGNATVVAVDAFDTLFQRPLADLVEAYRRLARPAVEATGFWPVIYGGERNCWPFPHDGRIPVRASAASRVPGAPPDWVHSIPWRSRITANHTPHLARRRFSVGAGPGLRGDEFCSAWLSRFYAHGGAPRMSFPFLCSGGAVGTVSAFRRLLREFMAIHARRGEYDDQAILGLVLMRNRSLGFVDAGAEIFLQLHGHDERRDLERPLCHGDYFAEADAGASEVPLAALRPPAVLTAAGAAPSVIHFNGNGKLHLQRCIGMFHAAGVLGPMLSSRESESSDVPLCELFDHDRRKVVRV